MIHGLVYGVVLTWNNFTDTDECLESLQHVTYPRFKVLVVDNGSTDGSKERLKERWSATAEFIENAENLQVAAGYNVGIRGALARDADYVLLLNDDVVVEPGLIEPLVGALSDWPETATVSAVITYFDRPDLVWFAGGSYSKLFGFTRHRFLGKPVPDVVSRLGKNATTDYVPTCTTLTSRRAFETIGLLDERFGITHDDVDWCLRCWDHGYEIRVIGKPLVRHKVSVSAGVRGSTTMGVNQAYHYARNGMIFASKRTHGLGWAPQLAGQFLIRFPYFAVQMLAARRWAGVLAYAKGLLAGVVEVRAGANRARAS